MCLCKMNQASKIHLFFPHKKKIALYTKPFITKFTKLSGHQLGFGIFSGSFRQRSRSFQHLLQTLAGAVSFSLLGPVGQGNVEWLGAQDTPIHLSHRFSGLLRRREADQPKPFASPFFPHYLDSAN